jgi:hypothetical protein
MVVLFRKESIPFDFFVAAIRFFGAFLDLHGGQAIAALFCALCCTRTQTLKVKRTSWSGFSIAPSM